MYFCSSKRLQIASLESWQTKFGTKPGGSNSGTRSKLGFEENLGRGIDQGVLVTEDPENVEMFLFTNDQEFRIRGAQRSENYRFGGGLRLGGMKSWSYLKIKVGILKSS